MWKNISPSKMVRYGVQWDKPVIRCRPWSDKHADQQPVYTQPYHFNLVSIHFPMTDPSQTTLMPSFPFLWFFLYTACMSYTIPKCTSPTSHIVVPYPLGSYPPESARLSGGPLPFTHGDGHHSWPMRLTILEEQNQGSYFSNLVIRISLLAIVPLCFFIFAETNLFSYILWH